MAYPERIVKIFGGWFMKRLMNSSVVDTRYSIGLRPLLIAGVLVNVIAAMIVSLYLPSWFNNRIIPIVLTIGIVIIFFGFEAYFVFGLFVKPITTAAKRLVLLAEGDLKSSPAKHTYMTEASVLVRAMNSVIEMNSKYINEIKRVLNEVENKNLTVEVKSDFVGDFAEIKASLVEIVDFLNDTVQTIRKSSNDVADSANQVSDGAMTFSQGSTEQASSIEKLSATISEIAEQIKHNALSAENAHEKADYARQELEQSISEMQDLINAMNNVTLKSSEISKIIRVIDDIAFQTNILALNAAVEAARAGESGKGFAVVANEVRTLASKSAEAAKNTSILIEETINAVETGAKTAD
jgi:methyl-accepting chemotaxis protein